jgi:YtkA-like
LSLGVAVLLGCGAFALFAVRATSGNQSTALAAASKNVTNVGPGPVVTLLHASDSTFGLSIAPNRSGAWNSVVLTISRLGEPVRHAAVTVSFTMLDMSMGRLVFSMSEKRPGRYVYVGPATTMPGQWQLAFRVKLQSGQRMATSVQDHVN